MKKLGFGMMRLPITDKDNDATIDMPLVEKMVDEFIARGFTYFDTAYMYHSGMSEKTAGEALVKRHKRDTFTLATKMPVSMLKEDGDLEKIFNDQLEKCCVDYFDYYLMHALGSRNHEKLVSFGTYEFLKKKRDEGKIRHLGFSFHDSAEFLDQLLTEMPEVEFVQLQLNYLDWDSDRVQSGACYDVAVKHGKRVVVMEPVKGGALANLPDEAMKLLKDADPDASAASWAIRFAASHENVMMVLSGMSNMEQLIDNTSYMADFKPITAADEDMLKKVVGILQSSVTVPCTACRYCMDVCPVGIPIPELFEQYNIEKRNKRLHNWGGNTREVFKELCEKHAAPTECLQCRACEGVCPQHLEISEILKDVVTVFAEKEE